MVCEVLLMHSFITTYIAFKRWWCVAVLNLVVFLQITFAGALVITLVTFYLDTPMNCFDVAIDITFINHFPTFLASDIIRFLAVHCGDCLTV